ncbi:ABC transporter ATP-binding protein [Erysipelothrix sp. HDW6C]|uniref:ABC transporter ATP-binding protein n=1 Tax=Erysipelothrix sp. HDW6C TaxID=2714930 RepID=UPI00140BAC3C|nr:ABC transporter ATP-binding protein [Erysipelothrix sp. HDW6C]QIK70757.1 ABC transporter ATP-binding protein [Erysipelothrix sp. HDW6C]
MLKKFMSYYKPHRKLMAFVLTMVALFTLIELSIPIFTRYILNDLIPAGNLQAVINIAMIMIGLLLFYALLHYMVGYYGHLLGMQIEKDMRLKAFSKLQMLAFDYYDVNKTGIIMTRLTSDLHEVSELAHHGIEEILSVSIMMILGYLYLIQLNFWVTTIFLSVFLLLMIGLVLSRSGLLVAFRVLRREHAQINSRLEGSISGIRLTRAFANEAHEVARFEADNDQYIDAYKGAYRALGKTNAMNQFFVQFVNVAVLVCCAILVVNGTFTTGDMFAYFLYFNMLVNPIKRIMTMLETFQQGWAGFERYEDLMREPVTIQNAVDARPLGAIDGAIDFKNVSFQYATAKERVLEDFSLSIPAGEMVALVGPSGVGKTTIAQLIPRFYETASGSIAIDGTDIKDVTLHSLREQIGYVQQDVIIFWGTIGENIAYGKPSASQRDIEAAAQKAGIHDFIASLPNGYDTMVGERGVMLSGGQKQRISIARIFLKDPRILILDEATSALDNITEAYIQASLETLAQGRTVLVVAHRLTTVQHADKIVVMGKEGVAQVGTHESLLAQEGHYRNLYEASKNNMLPESLDDMLM